MTYGGLRSLRPDGRATLSATSRQLLAENGDQSLMACYIALDSHRAKGQVCLKFALQCISGDDLDFLSLAPPRAQRWKGRGRERERQRDGDSLVSALSHLLTMSARL